jgi:hypothetical protein
MLAQVPTTPAGSCTVSAAPALAALRWRLFDVPWGSWNREELPYRRSEPFGEGSSQPVCQSRPLRLPPILLGERQAGAFVISCLPEQTGFRRSVLFCFMFHPSPKQRSRFLGSFISIPWFRRSPLLPPLGSQTADPLSFASEFSPSAPRAGHSRGLGYTFSVPIQPPLLLPSSNVVLHNNNNKHTTTAAQELKTVPRLTSRLLLESRRNLDLRDIHEIDPIPHLALQRRRSRKARACRRVQAAAQTGDSSTIRSQTTHTRASSQSTYAITMDIDTTRRNKNPRPLTDSERARLDEFIDSIHYSTR